MQDQAITPYAPRHSIADYRKAADDCFAKFSFLYRWSGNFWRLGHSFDTAIDYLAEKGQPSPAIAFARDVLNAFEDTRGHWYDDYGWWGLAASRAMARAPLFGTDLTGKFQFVRDKCWAFMDKGDVGDMAIECCKAQHPSNGVTMAGAPNVFEQARKVPNGDPGKLYDLLAPRFPGGVWNCDWSYTINSYNIPQMKWAEPCFCLPIYDLSNPNRQWAKDGLGGFQNTVTNALYYNLAARVGAAAEAKRAYGFFDAWIKASDGPDDDGLIHSWKNNDGHVVGFIRERVPAYKSPKENVWAYRPKLAWAGDQGLVVAAFADYLQANPNDNDLRNLLQIRTAALLRGALYYIAAKRKDGTGALVPGGRLRDWWDPNNPNAPGGDPSNYHTGSGVFWRSVKYAYDVDGGFKLLIPAIAGFKDFLAFNADAACDSAGQSLPEHVRSPDEALIAVTNDLATLMAGIHILGGS